MYTLLCVRGTVRCTVRLLCSKIRTTHFQQLRIRPLRFEGSARSAGKELQTVLAPAIQLQEELQFKLTDDAAPSKAKSED